MALVPTRMIKCSFPSVINVGLKFGPRSTQMIYTYDPRLGDREQVISQMKALIYSSLEWD